MKILTSEPVTVSYHRITTDDCNEYDRYSADCWKWVVGESVESVYDTKELEEAFQALSRSKGDK